MHNFIYAAVYLNHAGICGRFGTEYDGRRSRKTDEFFIGNGGKFVGDSAEFICRTCDNFAGNGINPNVIDGRKQRRLAHGAYSEMDYLRRNFHVDADESQHRVLHS